MATIKNFSGQILFYLENGKATKFSHQPVFSYDYRSIKKGIVGPTVYELDGIGVKKFAGLYEYEINGGDFKDYSSKKIMYRYDGSSIKDFYGRTLLKIDGNISKIEYAIICLILEGKLDI